MLPKSIIFKSEQIEEKRKKYDINIAINDINVICNFEESHPYRSGATASCGCMKPYHGHVCSMEKCCMKTLQCYGNCGDYTALYIFLAAVGVLVVFLGMYYRRISIQNNELEAPLPQAEDSGSNTK